MRGGGVRSAQSHHHRRFYFTRVSKSKGFAQNVRVNILLLFLRACAEANEGKERESAFDVFLDKNIELKRIYYGEFRVPTKF